MPCKFVTLSEPSVSGTYELDCENYDGFELILSGNATFEATGFEDGRVIVVKYRQAAADPTRTVTWDSPTFCLEGLPSTAETGGMWKLVFFRSFQGILYPFQAFVFTQ